ncbi:Hypothetical predicted protein [Cloeon dipterum]|uniref:PH domain-containing protein n=1 Tax=Cloeon dipterum TaxID=197152 RepID=A0A8S1CDT8_9INSE|nr:Hypothetical predicted protein [Cloeon dipterum]
MKGRLLSRVKIQVSGEFKSSDKTLAACLRISLALLDETGRQADGEQQVILDKIVSHLESGSQEVVEAALALLNTRTASETIERRSLLRARDLLATRLQAAVWPIDANFQQQLTIFQSRLTSRLVRKFECPANESDAKVRRRLSTLTAVNAPSKDKFAETTLRLLAESMDQGQGNNQPSLLLIDCLTHSVRLQLHQLSDDLLKHQPFLHLCEQLIKLLLENLGLLSKEKQEFHPILFCDRAFEEMFCACVRALNKTCKEMRAKGEDVPKILTVHGKKMQMALRETPLRPEKFEETLNKISYNQVWEAWLDEKEAQQERAFRQKASFLELREELRPQYEDMVKMQRLRVMTAGCNLRRYASKVHNSLVHRSNKERVVNMKYNANGKSFVIADPDEGIFKIHKSQIKNVLTGHNCPHAKQRGSKISPELALSINLTNADVEFINLSANSAKELDYWSDGIRALMGQSMVSTSYYSELQDLLDMHLKIHFLGMENVEFPDGPAPPVPETPSFANQLDINAF